MALCKCKSFITRSVFLKDTIDSPGESTGTFQSGSQGKIIHNINVKQYNLLLV